MNYLRLTRFNVRALQRALTLGAIFWLAFGPLPTPAKGEPIKPSGESQFLSNVHQLVYGGRRSGEGYFSPDGNLLIFQSERDPENPFYQIYILDFLSGDVHRVSPGVGKTTCAFFRPHSDEVLFASTHLDQGAKSKQKDELDFRASGQTRRYAWDYDDQMDIFSARRDGSHLQRLTDSYGYDAEASYSPDGRNIVFTSLRNAYPIEKLSTDDRRRLETNPAYFGEIYIMNADGSDQRRLTFWPGYDGGPFFSPDGSRILWRHFDAPGTLADIYTMKLDGSDMRRLTTFGSMSWAPYFHPSGRYVIFTSNKLGFSNFELFLVDSNGAGEPVRVTTTDGFDGLPVFSPDGRRLSWTSGRTADGKSQIFIADWNHPAALAALRQAPRRGQPMPLPKPQPEPASVVGVPPKPAKLSTGITENDFRAGVGYLAAPALAGRMTGTAGSALAAQFLAENLRRTGVKPLVEQKTYFQTFEFNSGVRVVTNQNHLSSQREGPPSAGREFTVEKDFRPLSFTDSQEATGMVVFAGYGLSAPGKEGERYDSYAGLDVTNKIVLALRYVPEGVEPKRRQELNRYAGLRYKAMQAREHGAKAILIVTGPNSPNAGDLVPLSFDSSLAGSGIVAASITTNVAGELLAGTGRDLKSLQTDLDTENPHAPQGFLVPGLKVTIAAGIEHLKKSDRNVLGFIPAKAGTSEFVMVGAHYDHLGFGDSGSLANKDEEGRVHPGADDNASGTTAVLELALALSAETAHKPESIRRGIIFAFWSGEELGLIGSSYFAEHPLVALSNIVAYVNFDMVGRLRENKLIVQGIGSSSVWPKLLEKYDVAAGFQLVLQQDPYLPTDVTAFYPKHVPVLNFFTGSHADYHRPTDTPDTLNYAGLVRVTRFARGLIADLASESTRPDYRTVENAQHEGGARENLRAYLGTIPDYTAEVAGVKLSGVRAGSPADKGGLKGGDVIVEFGGQKITNIYDYTYALDAAKIGLAVAIVVVRDGQRLPLTVVPEARK